MNTPTKLSQLRLCEKCGRVVQLWMMDLRGHCDCCQQEQKDLAAMDDDARRWREQREKEAS